MSAPATTSRSWLGSAPLLAVLSSACAGVAQFFFKLGAPAADGPRGLLGSGAFWAGIAAYALSFALTLRAFQVGRLNVVFGIEALSYVWVALLGVMVLAEPMDGGRLAGASLIVAGAFVLAQDGAAREEARAVSATRAEEP